MQRQLMAPASQLRVAGSKLLWEIFLQFVELAWTFVPRSRMTVFTFCDSPKELLRVAAPLKGCLFSETTIS